MKVVLADIEADPLTRVEAALKDKGADVFSHVTDAARKESVGALADVTFARFGNVHFLANNAGVTGGPGKAWEISEAEWDWVMDVDFWGVLYGIQAFVPHMLEQGEEGCVMATSSILGLSTGASSVYNVAKHAVARLMEGLHYDFGEAEAKLQALLLCPGPIATNIVKSARNRPVAAKEASDLSADARGQLFHKWLQEEGMPPAEVADMVFGATERDEFYVLTHPELIEGAFKRRASGILSKDKRPLPPPPDFLPE
jgi:NAD(P)-dependent dehydrogenase (short-subunit alcohol dehydrogenase family)